MLICLLKTYSLKLKTHLLPCAGTHLTIVFRRVGDAGLTEGFSALGASAADTAVSLVTAVAGVSVGKIDTQCSTTPHYVALRNICIRGHYPYIDICARLSGSVDSIDKLRPAIGIYGVVAAVIGYEHLCQTTTFGQATGNGQHDAVAEWHDGRTHVGIIIPADRHRIGSVEQRRVEIFFYEVERNDDMLYAETLTMALCTGDFAKVVVAAVVKRDSERDAVTILIQQGGGVESS